MNQSQARAENTISSLCIKRRQQGVNDDKANSRSKLPGYAVLGYKYHRIKAETYKGLKLVTKDNKLVCGSDPDNGDEGVFVLGYN